ncbi:nuclease-related domain-containing protein [Clostridium sp. BJN0001]|uniref:nuclease-related domain-containing protein n=1 Tax=Clostridium sp. BJN0001 TaxID=2930219 RepID=UPI001FD32E3A|nr:nuclease-related domain-containing protein [Clostridium sp. BJN0001]
MIECLIVSLLLIFIITSLIKNVYYKIKRNAIGKNGENEVNKIISKNLNRNFYILKDILLNHNEKTSQIDHIIISKKGIFVIETKNYSGKIIANKDKKYWTQFVKGEKHFFFNPILQNEGHIRMLKNILKYKYGRNINIYSVVVFTNRSKVENIDFLDSVIYINQLIKFIKNKKCSRKDMISKDDMNYLKDLILENNIKDKKIRNKHIKYVKEIAGKK